MKRLFTLLMVMVTVMSLRADSYHDALVTYLQNNGSSTAQQYEAQLLPILRKTFPDQAEQVSKLMSDYASTQMIPDLADIFDPAFRKHVSEQELQQLAAIYSIPRYKEVQQKMENALLNFPSSPDYQTLIASMSPAIEQIMSGKKPAPLAVSTDIDAGFRETFERYYKAAQVEQLIKTSFDGIVGPMNSQFRTLGIANAEQVTSSLLDYLVSGMPTILMQMMHREVSKEDMQMLIDATYSPAYRHTVDAASEMAKYPLVMSAQMMSKMCDWMEGNAPKYAKTFRPYADRVYQTAEPYMGQVYEVVEQNAAYPAGINELYKYIASNVAVSRKIALNGFEGKTVIGFVVNKNGELSEFKIMRSCGDSTLDAEVIRLLKASTWKPAMVKNEPVRSYFTLPVKFNIPPTPPETLLKQLEEEEENEPVFVVVEQMPEFPGGPQALFQYLKENVKYPVIAYENGIQGRVIAKFIVNKDGSISDVEVVKSGGDPSLDKEAVRVIKSMPKWKPGMQRGKPVRVQYTVPVNFTLPKDEETKKTK